MPKVPDVVKDAIKQLSKAELEKLVLKAAVKHKSFNDFLLVNYAPEGMGEEDLYEQAVEKIDMCYSKSYLGRSYEKKQNRRLMAQVAIIAAFDKHCKQKHYTLLLLLSLVKTQLGDKAITFGTWYQAYDNKIASLIKRINLIATKKLHPDLLRDYKADINWCISELKQRAPRVSGDLEEIR
jgi:hypothetical protein